MPEYDFRCEACAHRFRLRYKTYAQYDAAIPRCPACDSAALQRLISRVAWSKANRDYRAMSSQEMLSVLESGEGAAVDEMFRQVDGGPNPGGATASQAADEAAD